MRAVLDILYPPSCFGCDRDVAPAELPVCGVCRGQLVYVGERGCLRCGAEPLPGSLPSPSRCRRCRKRTFVFRRSVAGLRYAGVARGLLLQAKFAGEYSCLKGLSKPLVRALIATGVASKIDVISPVPLHPFRRMRRGFDQSVILASDVSRELGVPLIRNAIHRCRWQSPQATVSARERMTRLQGSFVPWVQKRRVRGCHVLLVDDVLTTGSTANAAARAVLQAGARSVRIGVAMT